MKRLNDGSLYFEYTCVIFLKKMARQFVVPVVTDGDRWRPMATCWQPCRKLLQFGIGGIDGNRLFDCSMLAAGLGLLLVAGLGLGGVTSILVAALQVG